MQARRYGTAAALCFAVLIAERAGCYDSPAGRAPIPPHSCPWVETRQPDVRTVLLWKFDTEDDRRAEAERALDSEDMAELLKGQDDDSLRAPAARPEPELAGGARMESGAGRFGGGLALNGSGWASAPAPFQSLLNSDGGLTLDMWFKAADTRGGKSARLASFGDGRSAPALAVDVDARGGAALAIAGEKRLEINGKPTRDGWHHLFLIIDSPAERPDAAGFTLGVDGEVAVLKPQGKNGVADVKRLKEGRMTRLIVGASGGEAGFSGIVDEVRLSQGVRYLYPWNLGAQERPSEERPEITGAPFFAGSNVLCRFTFDGTLAPDPAGPMSASGAPDSSHFQDGVCGKALSLADADRMGVVLRGYGLVPDRNGTVEFWFRPLEWNNFYLGDYHGTDVGFYHLLELKRENGSGGVLVKDIEVYRGRAGRHADLRWTKFHPGAWTHVLICLRDGGQTVYLNGRRQALWQAGCVTRGEPAAQEILKKLGQEAGEKDDGKWVWSFVKSPTLIDELSVYSWGMTEEEAWNAYARWLPDAAGQMKPIPTVRAVFDYWAHSWDMTEKLVVRLSCLPAGKGIPRTVDIAVRDSAGKEFFSAEKQALDETGNVVFSIPKQFPFGRYEAVVRTRGDAGGIIEEQKLTYVREKPSWYGNTLGKGSTVPSPWVPVSVEENVARILGRKIRIGRNGLPEAVESCGIPVLAGPAALRAGGVAMEGLGWKLSGRSEDAISWTSEAGGGGIRAEISGRLEFDGLMAFSVVLKPASGSEIQTDDVSVVVPLRPDAAGQLLANGGGNDFRSSWIAKYVPKDEGALWNSLQNPYPHFCRATGVSNFMPHVWVGADEVGMYFGAENDKGWTIDGPKPAQELVRVKDAVEFRMNVIREPTVIPAAGRRFGFVILPTPAKPEPPDWRRQMAMGGVNFGSCDSFGGFDMKTDPQEPQDGDSFRLEPRSWEHAESMAAGSRSKWGRCILYADASWPRPGDSFRDWNHDLWAGTGRIAWTPEFEDYAVWAVNEYLRRGLIDGIYWDDVSVGCTFSLAAGGYQTEAGSRRVGFTALAQRRVNMRLWRLFEAAGKEPCIWAHMTACYEVPVFSFCRYLSNGEFPPLPVFAKRDPMDFWSFDTLRILGNAAKWGAGVSFLSTLPRQMNPAPQVEQWAYPQRRAETALFLSCDIYTVADGLGRKLEAEGFFDEPPVRVWPWWKSGEAVEVAAPEGSTLRTVVYGFKDRAVVLIANADRLERDVTVALHPAVLGSGAVKWRDIDPGLKPPAAAMASAEEIGRVGEKITAGLDEKNELGEGEIEDMIEGTTPEQRAMARLELRADGAKARVLVRPRDYRALEASIRR